MECIEGERRKAQSKQHNNTFKERKRRNQGQQEQAQPQASTSKPQDNRRRRKKTIEKTIEKTNGTEDFYGTQSMTEKGWVETYPSLNSGSSNRIDDSSLDEPWNNWSSTSNDFDLIQFEPSTSRQMDYLNSDFDDLRGSVSLSTRTSPVHDANHDLV